MNPGTSINGTFNPGRLEVIVGTMFSGKSKSLIETCRDRTPNNPITWNIIQHS